jgi:protein-S-isoprenylcysteine O-methyltransferase Ste14
MLRRSSRRGESAYSAPRFEGVGAKVSFQLKAVIFIVVTFGFVWLSRISLHHLRSHGFYRFFAWEAIALLVLLNVDYWFREPFSSHQLVAWPLLTICLYWVVHGTYSLHTVGKPDQARNDDPTLIGIEKTTELATVGAYRYIRHPLYSSLLFGTWGVFFEHLSWITASLAAIATFFLAMTAKSEEVENLHFFGDDYRRYMKQTKMFVPFVF